MHILFQMTSFWAWQSHDIKLVDFFKNWFFSLGGTRTCLQLSHCFSAFLVAKIGWGFSAWFNHCNCALVIWPSEIFKFILFVLHGNWIWFTWWAFLKVNYCFPTWYGRAIWYGQECFIAILWALVNYWEISVHSEGYVVNH